MNRLPISVTRDDDRRFIVDTGLGFTEVTFSFYETGFYQLTVGI
jgi:hypothetical protein